MPTRSGKNGNVRATLEPKQNGGEFREKSRNSGDRHRNIRNRLKSMIVWKVRDADSRSPKKS